MNYKMLFIVTLISTNFHARHYESIFSQWGRSLDEMYEGFDSFSSRRFTHESVSPAFSLEKSDTAVLVTVDTGKKVTEDDMIITHKNNRVLVDVKGLEHTLSLKLESSQHAFGISLCSKTNQEKKSQEGFSEFYGSSCMQQVMSVAVDLSGITAEYSGTKLVLSIPLIQQEQGKKIQVTMKDSSPEAKKVTKKQKSTSNTLDEK